VENFNKKDITRYLYRRIFALSKERRYSKFLTKSEEQHSDKRRDKMKTFNNKAKESLENIFPFGTKISNATIEDLPQALYEIVDELQGRMLEKYPHNAEKINEAYSFIKSDIKGEIQYLDK